MSGDRERLRASDRHPWDKSRAQNIIYVLKMTAMAIGLLVGFVWTANFLMDYEAHRGDFSCSRSNPAGPTIADTMLISGCAGRASLPPG